ncbi:MAG: hypothetical protein ACE5E7_11085 [Anaerolineae bacterium]
MANAPSNRSCNGDVRRTAPKWWIASVALLTFLANCAPAAGTPVPSTAPAVATDAASPPVTISSPDTTSQQQPQLNSDAAPLELTPVSLTAVSANVQVDVTTTENRADPVLCPNLDSVLVALSTAGDAADFAASHQLMLAEAGVAVEIHLAHPETADLTQYQVSIRNKRGAIIEAYVPVPQLCALSEDSAILQVKVIRPASTP